MDNSKQLVLRAFRRLFRPIAGILLRAGVTWREVLDTGKATYVEVATNEFGIRGRPTNVSRVALLTGLTRKEVARLRKLLEESNPDPQDAMNHATRVLTGWHTDPDFCDEDGSPRALDRDGSNTSFAGLCKRYVGDVPPTTLLKELMHVGAVEAIGDQRVIAKMRIYMPRQLDDIRVLSSGSVVEDIGNTVAYNLFREADDRPRFERRATNTRVKVSALPAFQEFLEAEGQAFLERVDAWLSDHEANENSEEASVRLGLGAYWIEG